MVLKFMNKQSNNKETNHNYGSNYHDYHHHVGLGILTQISQGKSNYVVVKSGLRLRKPAAPTSSSSAAIEESNYCFLKTCNLCNKSLSLDKEVYMYRGDQGFCSIECRERQIYVDEMRELEASTKQMIASYRKSCNISNNNNNNNINPARHETGILLEQLRQSRHHHHKPLIPHHRRNINNNHRPLVIS